MMRKSFSSELGFVFCSMILGTLPCLAQTSSDGTTKERSTEAFGSLAVAIVREDTIAVLAESRTITDGIVNPDTTCKITVVNNIVFAATGLIRGSSVALDIVDYARDVLERPGKREDKFNKFQEGVSKLLTSWMNLQEFHDSLAISPYFRYRHTIHTMFCFFAKSNPVIVEYTFVPVLDGKQFKISGIYDAGKRKSGEIIWIGTMEQTDTLLKTQTRFSERIKGMSAIAAGEALIQKQMEFTPRIVGGNIDVAVVTSKGAQWVRRKQNCY